MVKENYKVFVEYMEGILTKKKLYTIFQTRHNPPWINIFFRLLRRFKKARKSGLDDDKSTYSDIEQWLQREKNQMASRLLNITATT